MSELAGLTPEEIERRALLWTHLARLLGLTTETVAVAAMEPPRTEAERQRDLYADLLARIPDGRYEHEPIEYRHPDLALLSDKAWELRCKMLPRLLYRIRDEDAISWYGGLRRTHSDGGNGMYCTPGQAEDWRDRVDSGVTVIGPS